MRWACSPSGFQSPPEQLLDLQMNGERGPRKGVRERGGRGMKLHFSVNGRSIDLEVSPFRRLLDVLRDDLGLTGAKEGCGEGGMRCLRRAPGRPARECLPGARAPSLRAHGGDHHRGVGDGRRAAGSGAVRIHGRRRRSSAASARRAWSWPPGLCWTRTPAPNRAEIRRGLAGNLCPLHGLRTDRTGGRAHRSRR